VRNLVNIGLAVAILYMVVGSMAYSHERSEFDTEYKIAREPYKKRFEAALNVMKGADAYSKAFEDANQMAQDAEKGPRGPFHHDPERLKGTLVVVGLWLAGLYVAFLLVFSMRKPTTK
jgi:hypothetical protein